MTVSMHKISAGDGYLYLVRSVAASDATHRGRSTLSDYYSVKGEAPGKWMGSGLAALSDPSIGLAMSEHTIAETWSVPEGSEVHEDQMKALFGEGLHPNAAKITKYLTARGTGTGPAHKATKLGSKFKIYEDPPFIKALAQAYQDHSMAAGHSPFTKLDPDTKATIKTELARAWFVDEYGRAPADDRELSGYMARVTRPAKWPWRRTTWPAHRSNRSAPCGRSRRCPSRRHWRTVTRPRSPMSSPKSSDRSRSRAWAPTAPPRSTPRA